MLNTYVIALTAQLHENTDTAAVLRSLRATMAARGHAALYPRVLRATLRRLEAAPHPVTIRVARSADHTTHAAAIKSALNTLGAPAEVVPHLVVDDTLIGGYAVEHNHHVVDATYKNALITLYHRITNS